MTLKISLTVPEEFCRETPYSMECVTDRDYGYTMHNKWLAILQNRKRFESNSYTDGKVMIKESELAWIPIPLSGATIHAY